MRLARMRFASIMLKIRGIAALADDDDKLKPARVTREERSRRKKGRWWGKGRKEWREKLPGTSLKDLIPQMDEAARVAIAKELKTILAQLAALDGAGEMGLFGRPFTYGDLFFPNFDFHDPGGKIHTMESFVHWIPSRLKAVFGIGAG
ncbi:hypothetical protein DFH06DRAFT_1130057 [Mycena polygramma]|nr:hypothetical protein DFH06DRAFT_1130057 [Mycena polygramma]